MKNHPANSLANEFYNSDSLTVTACVAARTAIGSATFSSQQTPHLYLLLLLP